MRRTLLPALLSFTAFAQAQEAAPAAPQLWRDPSWKLKLLGLYGTMPDVEPEKVTDAAEVEALRVFGELIDKKDFAGAAATLQKVITPSSHPLLNVQLAAVFADNQITDRAIIHLNEAVRKFSNYRRAHEGLGQLYFQKGDLPAAVRHFARALELGAKDAVVYGALGSAYTQLGQYISAESAYRNALLFSPDNANYKMGLANVFAEQKKYAESAALFAELIATNQREPRYWEGQTRAYVAMKDLASAQQNLEIMRSLGIASAKNLAVLGNLYLEAGLHDAAVGAFESALDKEPGMELRPLITAANSMARRNGYEPAKKLIARIQKAAGADFKGADKKRLQDVEAFVATSTGATADYLRILEEMVANDPTDGATLLNLAKHYDTARAAAKDEKESSEAAAKASAWYGRAEALAEIAATESATAVDPAAKERVEKLKSDAADAFLKHGLMLYGMKQMRAARDKMKMSQTLKARDSLPDMITRVEKLAKAEEAEEAARQTKLQSTQPEK